MSLKCPLSNRTVPIRSYGGSGMCAEEPGMQGHRDLIPTIHQRKKPQDDYT